MKFSGIYSSQSIDKHFDINNIKHLYRYAVSPQKCKVEIIIGHEFKENTYVAKYVAIQLAHTSSFETYQVFDAEDMCFEQQDDLVSYAITFAENVLSYVRQICHYYGVQNDEDYFEIYAQ